MEAVLTRALILSLVAIAPAVLAAETLPTSGELDCDDTRLERCEYFDPASGLLVRLPQDWPMRRLRVSTETGPSASVHQRFAERWVVIEYLPEEPTNPEASLFQAAVLPRAAWLRCRRTPIRHPASRSRPRGRWRSSPLRAGPIPIRPTRETRRSTMR